MDNGIYTNVLNVINSLIEKFNSELNNHSVKMEFLFNLNGLSWADLNLGKANYKGVYILLGTDDVTKDVVIYIGKASMKSSIGKRIYSHFLHKHEQGNEPKYTFDNYHCTMECVYGVNFSKEGITFFAPALEEYLITNMRYDLLLNDIK